MKSYELFSKLKNIIHTYSGGAVYFKEFTKFEEMKPKTSVMYKIKYCKDGKVIIMWIPKEGL